MTILGGLFPRESRWGSVWDSYSDPGWGPSWNDSWFSSPSKSSQSSEPSKVIEIPIQIIRSGNSANQDLRQSGCHVEWSDSDSGNYDGDMNWNSYSGRPRKRRSDTDRQTPPKLRSSKGALKPEVIEIDSDSPKKNIHLSSSGYKVPSSSTASASLARRGLAPFKERDNKLDFIICDSDTENEINETSNYSVYQYLKGFLGSTGRQIDSIRGDGNCFFRALSKVIYGSQLFHNDVRQAVVDVIAKYPKRFEAFTDGNISDHIRKMREDKTWATQTEIYAAATLLNRDIYILSADQTGEMYRWLLFKPQFKYNASATGCKCYITLCHTHGNHYDRIAACESSCNCSLPPPEMSGVKGSVDLTDENEIV